jgi:nicotinamidase-related amidase
MAVSFSAYSHKLDSTALVLIDIQDFYFPGGAAELVEAGKAAKQAKIILKYFRENDGLVVHVKHEVKSGGDIHKFVTPVEGEKVIVKNEVSCFNGTHLHELLKMNGIKNLVLAGMQTHMCLEGGTRAAYDLGYRCTVIADACATRDLKFGEKTVMAEDVHASTLATLKSYAQVINVAEFLK